MAFFLFLTRITGHALRCCTTDYDTSDYTMALSIRIGGSFLLSHSSIMGSVFYTLDDLKVESRRLSTFIDWPKKANPRLTPSELAKEGFYYLRFKDHCACAFCRGIIGAWEPRDTPRGEHKRHFSHCEFLVSGKKVNNVTIDEEKLLNIAGVSALTTIGNEGVTIPKIYESIKRREESFEEKHGRNYTYSWPLMCEFSPSLMAYAGFYYAGLSDHVRCFYCSLGLRNWVAGSHEPLFQHLKYSPDCEYAMGIRDLTLLDSEVMPFAMSDSEGYAHDDIIDIVVDNYIKSNNFIDSVINSGYCDNTTCVQAVKMHFKTHKRLFSDCSELERAVDAINNKKFTAELLVPVEQPTKELLAPAEQPIAEDLAPVDPPPSAESTKTAQAPVSGPVSEAVPEAAVTPNWNEEEFYENMSYCLICAVNIRNVVNEKCGHFVTCSKCSTRESMAGRSRCVTCHATLKGTRRIKWS